MRQLSVSVQVPRVIDDFEAMARRVASIALDDVELVEPYDQLAIEVAFGLDIFIASTRVHKSYTRTIVEWRREVPRL